VRGLRFGPRTDAGTKYVKGPETIPINRRPIYWRISRIIQRNICPSFVTSS